jgi:hypothetical protein
MSETAWRVSVRRKPPILIGEEECRRRFTSLAKSSTLYAFPPPTFKISKSVLLFLKARIFAATTSLIFTKSRICAPSSNTVMGLPRSACVVKIRIAPE